MADIGDDSPAGTRPPPLSGSSVSSTAFSSLPAVPRYLPLHFPLDAPCDIDSVEEATSGLDAVMRGIEVGWRSVRETQERIWATTRAKGETTYGLKRSIKEYGASEEVVFGNIPRRVEDPESLRDCVRVLSVLKQDGARLTETDLRELGVGSLQVLAVLDCTHDPLLDDLKYLEHYMKDAIGSSVSPATQLSLRHLGALTEGSAMDPIMGLSPMQVESGSILFVVRMFLYERGFAQVRVARLSFYDYALVFPELPYPDCSLSEDRVKPERRLDTLFPADNEGQQGPMVMGIAKAHLTVLFWQCFEAIEGILKQEAEAKGHRSETGSFLPDWAMVPMLTDEKGSPSASPMTGFPGIPKFRYSSGTTSADTDAGISLLQHFLRPGTANLPCRTTVSMAGRPGRIGVLAAIEEALRQAAMDFNVTDCYEDQQERMGAERPEKKHRWLLHVRASDGDDALNGRQSFIVTDAALQHSEASRTFCKSLKGKLVWVECEIQLAAPIGNRVSCRGMATPRPMTASISRKAAASYAARILVDIEKWEAERTLTVYNLNLNSYLQIHSTLRAVEHFERLVSNQSTVDQELADETAELMFGLNTVRRASIKDRLQGAGLVVREAMIICKEVDDKVVATSIGKTLKLNKLRRLREIVVSALPWTTTEVVYREKRQRVFFLAAPNALLEDRAAAERLRMPVRQAQNGIFVGGFRPSQFRRYGAEGPMERFWVESPETPYPYKPYFQLSWPTVDPLCVATPAERLYLVRSVISDPVSDEAYDKGGADVDLSFLKSLGILESFYTLPSTSCLGQLESIWARPWSKLGYLKGLALHIDKEETIDMVAKVFGLNVASHFAFTRHYCLWLRPLALIGVLMEIVSWFITVDVAHALRPAFGLLVCLWGPFFMGSWKAKVERLRYRWPNNLTRLSRQVAGSRKVTRAAAGEFRRKFETDKEEDQLKVLQNLKQILAVEPKDGKLGGPFDNWKLRSDIENFVEVTPPDPYETLKAFLARLVTLVFVLMATAAALGSLWLQDYLMRAKFQSGMNAMNGHLVYSVESDDEVSDHRRQMSYVVSSVVSCLIIPVLNALHKNVAHRTTEFQGLQQEGQYQSALFWKLYLFQFVNSYNGLFWIAFRRRDMAQLRTQLFVLLMVSHILAGNMVELVVPVFMKRFKSREKKIFSDEASAAYGSVGRAVRQLQQQRTGSPWNMEEEKVEVVIRFGAMCMFALALPSVAIVTLLSELIEIRTDAYKLVKISRQPAPVMMVGIGPAATAMQIIVFLSFWTNALLAFRTYHGKWQVLYDLVGATELASKHALYEKQTPMEALLPGSDWGTQLGVIAWVCAAFTFFGILVSSMNISFDKDLGRLQYIQEYYLKRKEVYQNMDEFGEADSKDLRFRNMLAKSRTAAGLSFVSPLASAWNVRRRLLLDDTSELAGNAKDARDFASEGSRDSAAYLAGVLTDGAERGAALGREITSTFRAHLPGICGADGDV
eukprot:TRINITY_DN41105_c0_g1_i1.p1 TRINITY_DN41105_c0_g1~~TRINITY_DN41105_c0_g1_i1.p1  ORF type:complete len:1476 (+),score=291.64 TRINITY_DN41105_c0_g1_i1:127-4554(+)